MQVSPATATVAKTVLCHLTAGAGGKEGEEEEEGDSYRGGRARQAPLGRPLMRQVSPSLNHIPLQCSLGLHSKSQHSIVQYCIVQ